MATLKTAPVETSLAITYVARDKINFWADNPRRNDKAALEVSTLILKNGMKSPINLWKKDMVVYKGNTSLKALDLLHKAGKRIVGIRYIGNVPHIPVILHEFTDKEAAVKYGLADNKASEFAEWDDDILAGLLASKSMRSDLSATGFTEKDVANLNWEPDKTRLRDIKETDAGMLAKIVVHCKPEDKEGISALLSEWAEGSGFEGVIVK